MVVQMAGNIAAGVTGVGEMVGNKVGEAVATSERVGVFAVVGTAVCVGTAVPVAISAGVIVAVGLEGTVRVGGTAVTFSAAVTAVGVGVGSTLVQAASSQNNANGRMILRHILQL
jgi:hypothetical protein